MYISPYIYLKICKYLHVYMYVIYYLHVYVRDFKYIHTHTHTQDPPKNWNYLLEGRPLVAEASPTR